MPEARRSFVPRWASMVVAVIVLVSLLVVGFALISSRALIYGGITQIDQARSQLGTVSNSASADAALSRATVSVQRAHTDFATADQRLSPLRPILEHLGWVPYFGGQLAAAPSAAKLAGTTTAGVLELLQGIRPVVHAARKPGGGHRLSQLSASVSSQTPSFERAYALFTSATRIRRSVPPHPPSQLAAALRTLDTELPRLRAASLSLALAPGLLGTTSPRTYLLAYQDPLELRATGGFIGSIGLVTLNGGSLAQRFEGTEIGNREKLLVPAPEPVSYYNEIWWLLRDSNWSPDFPTTAALERYFLRMDLGVNPKGVIDLTPQAAADVLAATGPIYLPEYHRQVSAQNLAQLADYYTHWAPSPGPLRNQNGDTRKQFIAIVGQHLVTRIDTLDVRGWIRLAASLEGAVARGDILIDFPDAREEQMAGLLGAAGSIDQTSSDYLYVVDTNLSYNKINPYVHESTHYDVTIRPDGWLDARLAIRLNNKPEPVARMSQGWGPGGGTLGGPDDYADFLRVYAPAGAQLVEQSGWTEPWTSGAAYGKSEFCGYIIVKRGRTAVIRLHYVIPPNVLSWSGGKRYRLVIQHQPGSHPDEAAVMVRDAAGDSHNWKIVRPDRDWSKAISIAPLAVHPIPLPRQHMPIVSPGHWIEPHVYLTGPRLASSHAVR